MSEISSLPVGEQALTSCASGFHLLSGACTQNTGITQISLGCAIINGALKCVQKGLETAVISSGVKQIDSNFTSVCAVLENSELKCMGDITLDGVTNLTSLTTIIPSGVSQLAVGRNELCVIMSGTGELKCRHNTFSGFYNPLGNGKINVASFSPVAIIPSGVKQVSVGYSHACAVLNSGELKCWGSNDSGSLGDGTNQHRLTPTTIIATGVKQVSANLRSTCAIMMSGELKCWGGNQEGQLGDGTTETKPTPTTIIASGVSQVAIGITRGCAIVNGSLNCWGSSTVYNFNERLPSLPISVPNSEGVAQVIVDAKWAQALINGKVYDITGASTTVGGSWSLSAPVPY